MHMLLNFLNLFCDLTQFTVKYVIVVLYLLLLLKIYDIIKDIQ